MWLINVRELWTKTMAIFSKVTSCCNFAAEPDLMSVVVRNTWYGISKQKFPQTVIFFTYSGRLGASVKPIRNVQWLCPLNHISMFPFYFKETLELPDKSLKELVNYICSIRNLMLRRSWSLDLAGNEWYVVWSFVLTLLLMLRRGTHGLLFFFFWFVEKE